MPEVLKVRDLSVKFGDSAGKIWKILSQKGPLHRDTLKKDIQLKNDEFFGGIGWLARENKIALEEQGTLKLDDTNLTRKIGNNAGRVWKILDIWGDVDIHSITRLADMQEEEVHTALGWLAREDKILVDEFSRFKLKEI